MTLQDMLDPFLDASQKGFPHHSGPLRRSAIGSQGWNVLKGDLPLPLAVIRRFRKLHQVQIHRLCGRVSRRLLRRRPEHAGHQPGRVHRLRRLRA